MSRRRALPLGVLLVATAVVSATACGGGGGGGGAARSGPPFAGPGPYAAGVTTLDLGDREVEVWYPADRGETDGAQQEVYHLRDWLPPSARQALEEVVAAEDLPRRTADPAHETDAYRDIPASREGPFPVVLFSHGIASYRAGSSFLTTHLASWGFVVAAPDFLERGIAAELGSAPATPLDEADVLRQTIGLMTAEGGASGGQLEGRIAPAGFAVVGHSAGGATSIRFGDEPGVVTYIALAAGIRSGPGAAPFTPPAPPSMWIGGSIDGVMPLTNVQTGFNRATPPARLVVIGGAGHQAFSDLCTLGRGGRGVVASATSDQGSGGVSRFASDGCQREAVDLEAGWRVINHYVTAQLRDAFGIEAGVGLDAATVRGFDEVTVTYTERG